MDAFWIVMADAARTSVGHRHASFELARAEAERLARAAKSRFYVLAVVGAAAPAEPPVEWTSVDSDSLDNLPF